MDNVKTPNIVVLGATGNQGLAVVQHLHSTQKANVYAVSRGPEKPMLASRFSHDGTI